MAESGFNVGRIFATLGASFPASEQQQFAEFDRDVSKARREAARPVDAQLGSDYDPRGVNAFDRDLRQARVAAARPIKATLGAEIDSREFARYRAELEKVRREAGRRDAFQAHLGGDFDERAFRAFSRGTSGAGRDVARLRNPLGGLKLDLFTLQTRIPLIKWGALGTGAAGAAGGVVSLASALAPMIGLLGAVPGAAATAIEGFASIKLAGSGVGDAIKAAFTEQDKAATTASSSAQTQASGIEAVRSAAQSLTDAQRQERIAEEDLNHARQDATRQLEDLRAQVRGLALDEKGANLSLREARQALRDVENDPTASLAEVEEAQLRVQQAREEVRNTKREARRAREDLDAAGAGGRNLSSLVAARRQVADAQRAVTDSAHALAVAQSSATAAMAGGGAAASAYAEKLAKLPKPAQEFVKFIIGLRPRIKELQTTAAAGLFPGVEKGLRSAMANFPVVQRMIGGISKALGDVAAQAGKRLGSAEWGRDLDSIGKSNETTTRRLGTASIFLADALRDVTVAAEPMVNEITKAALAFAKHTAAEAETGRETGRLQRFFKDAWETTHSFWHILQDLGGALKNIGTASRAAWGNDLLTQIEHGAAALERWTATAKGQRELRGIFRDLRSITEDVANAIGGVITRYRNLRREGKTTGAALVTIFGDAIAQIAGNVGKSVPRIVEAFVRGFLESDVWGKLIIGGWLITKLGGRGAWTAIGRRLGASLGLGVAEGAAPGIAATEAGAARGGVMPRGGRLPGGRAGTAAIVGTTAAAVGGSAVGGDVGTHVANVGGMAATGAVLGSVLPGPGTLAGAGIGAAVGVALDKPLRDGLINLLKKNWKVAIGSTLGPMGALLGALLTPKLRTAILHAFKVAGDTIVAWARDLPGVLRGAARGAARGFERGLRSLPDALTDVFAAVWRILRGVPGRLASAGLAAGRAYVRTLRRAWGALGDVASDAIRALFGFLRTVPRRLLNLASSAGHSYVHGLTGGLRGIAGMVRDALGGLFDLMRGLPDRLIGLGKSAGSAILHGIVRGLKSAPGLIKRAINDLIPDKVLGIKVPGQGRTGGYVAPSGIRGFATGGLVPPGEDTLAALRYGEFVVRKEAVEKIGVPALHQMNQGGVIQPPNTTGVTNALGQLPGQTQAIGADAGKGLAAGLAKGADAASKTAADVRDKVVGSFESLRDRGGKRIDDFAEKVGDRFSDVKDSALDATADLKDKVGDRFGDLRDTAIKRTSGMSDKVTKEYRDMRVGGTKHVKELASNTGEQLKRAQTFGKVRGKGVRDAVAGSYESMDRAVGTGLGYVARATSQALQGLGGESLKFTVPKPGKLATGGFVGMPGERGADTEHYLLGRGEAVLSGHQQGYINSMLGMFGESVNSVVGRIQRPHYAAKGKAGESGETRVAAMMREARHMDRAHFAYKFGGAHSTPAPFVPWDCSSAVSRVVQAAYNVPTVSTGTMGSAWRGILKGGPGGVTIFVRQGGAGGGHTFMRIGSSYFGTSGENPGGGAGFWSGGDAGYQSAFTKYHLTGIGDAAGGVGGDSVGDVKVKGRKGPLREVATRAIAKVRTAANRKINRAVAAANDASGDSGDSSGSLAQAAVARILYQRAKAKRAPGIATLAEFETALVESNMQNLPRGDRDSLGVFQQRSSWGTAASRMNVGESADRFLAKAIPLSRNWTGTPGHLAQAVQISAYPERYDQQERPARNWIARMGGYKGVAHRAAKGKKGTPDPFPRAFKAITGSGNRQERSFKKFEGRISDLGDLYTRKEARYNVIEEDIVLDPGDKGYNERTAIAMGRFEVDDTGKQVGLNYIDQTALKTRAKELHALVEIRRKIVKLYDRWIKAVQKVERTYQRGINRLLRIQRKAPAKRRKGYAKQIDEIHGRLVHARSIEKGVREGKFGAVTDRMVDEGEERALLPDAAGDLDAPEVSSPSSDSGGSDGAGGDDDLQARLDQATELLAAANASIRGTGAALTAFAGPGDIGVGGFSALDAVRGAGGPAGPGYSVTQSPSYTPGVEGQYQVAQTSQVGTPGSDAPGLGFMVGVLGDTRSLQKLAQGVNQGQGFLVNRSSPRKQVGF